MNGLKYTLLLEEPVLANSLAGDTNSARSLPYIPGGLVRGALIGAYANGSEIDASHGDFRRLFLDGRTRYLPAYPELNGKRTIPAPLAWKVKKHANGEFDPLLNFAADDSNRQPDLKTVGFDLWQMVDQHVDSLDQDWNINVHTQRDAVYGKAMGRILNEEEARGAVFRYEALPAGLRLSGFIFTSRPEDTKTLMALLKNRSFMLGKARTAGYGQARVEAVEPLKENWREEYWPWPPPAGEIKTFTLTFLSPAILRDANGQYTLDPNDALREMGIEAKAEKTFCGSEIAGGFNRTWGLPLPQCRAIAAGSVFVFASEKGIAASALQKLEETGLGERLAEGFGCVAIDNSQFVTAKWHKVTHEPAALTNGNGKSASAQRVGSLMLNRLLRRDLDAKVLAFVAKALGKYDGGLTGSQLSRWRVIVRSVLGVNDPEQLKRLTDLYEKERERSSTAWKKMERVRIGVNGTPQRLTEWLGTILTESNEPWVALGYTESPARTAGDLSFTADESLKFEYRLRMIDMLFAALAKKSKAEKGGAK